MSVKPILFNTAMVQAILGGRKTVTRRVLAEKVLLNKKWGLDREPYLHNGKWYYDEQTAVDDSRTIELKAKCQPGDILYVRETWHKYSKRIGKGESCHLAEFYGYKASVKNSEDSNTPWKPSIHMPKEAARIWLKVTNVRVERLQNITEEQAKAEGISEECATAWWKPTYNDPDSGGYPEYRKTFAWDLWNSTVKKADIDRYGWKANPWVWVIEFERCEKPQEDNK